MIEQQKTIKEPVSISGVGLHTGQNVTITLKPAPENHGYKFKRIDLEGEPVVHADVDRVVSTQRGTTLEENGARIHTTEHLLAAVYGMEIDNLMIEMDGPEVPILDGSSRHFLEMIHQSGIQNQKAEKRYFELRSNMTFEDPERQVEMLAVPAEDFRITVMVDYNSPLLGTQHASMYNIGEFADDFGNCRTFVFLRELMQLVNAGLIKGGDVNNAIVMVDTSLSEEEKDKLAATFDRPKSQLQEIGIGILNNVELRYENEPARHKLLDIVGDLALVGVPIKGHILAARPGHATNVEFGKMLKALIRKERNSAPVFDLNADPIYDINHIAEMLPHRYPFLLIDKVIEISDTHVVGVKNVTFNEEFFQGHFPGNPVMPGVLMIEAMAQTGGILVLSNVPDPTNYETYFIKIDKVKFKQKVIPGDTLIFRMDLASPIRRGICHMKGVAYVRDRVVAEGELMAQIIKKSNDE
ncbi:MAG: bifunctional UDP-3-O-[3-hydroxymyristoyl] N-acetylglucosamine deacetylase/3-hydroxyacyl-ACP dehydratase [Salibacteraceae bacterium]